MAKAILNKKVTIPAHQMENGQYGLVVNHPDYKGMILMVCDDRRIVCISNGMTWSGNCALEVSVLKTGDVITITV
jgi:hypothetical protein